MSATGAFSSGDIVATPDGRGVVAAVLTDDFEFPQGSDELVEMSASEDDPVYVVGLERTGSAVYPESALEPSSFEDDVPAVEGEALTDVVNESVDGIDELPEGWDRQSVLDYWEEVGGEWSECVQKLTDEFSEERAEGLCSAMKDEVLGTTRWRNRF